MGEIRDATLRTGIIHLCSPCNEAQKKIKTRLAALELKESTDGFMNKDDLFGGVFKDIFGNK